MSCGKFSWAWLVRPAPKVRSHVFDLEWLKQKPSNELLRILMGMAGAACSTNALP